LNDAVEFAARASAVVDTRRATVLGADGHRVSTVEHLLSALAGTGVTNALIAVDGPEIPALDGSAAPFVEAIDAAGIDDQGSARAVFAPDRPWVFRDGDKLLVILPAPALRVRMTIDFPAPVGVQYADVTLTPASYRAEVARNRTFGYRHEVEALLASGLAMGGSLDNAVAGRTRVAQSARSDRRLRVARRVSAMRDHRLQERACASLRRRSRTERASDRGRVAACPSSISARS
jgi:UDP-3-O-[3-hydroxymyristoyl] N-acetylglucosamine deacetylase